MLNPFTLTIDEYGYFSKPRIVWAGPSSPPETLISLQCTLWQSLLDNGVPLKPAAVFKPHVTLARDAERLDRLWKNNLEWTVDTIALVESTAIPGGVRYRPVATRSL
jgi:2'-5' RNA ligase